jgi:hypothetical protein
MHGPRLTESLADSIYSAKNRLFWNLRSRLRFRRGGYREAGISNLILSDTERKLEKKYELDLTAEHLSDATYKKNLWTLWLLDRMLAPQLRRGFLPLELLEPGCQDFARLPALRAFFRMQGVRPRITGIEVDPFPVLHDFHSRWDKAKYYLSLETSADRYLEGDFFEWRESADLICCFYPFMSAYPALAWGLPARFGNAKPWTVAFERNLRPGGLLLVVHQGEWEESDFDEARAGTGLRLLHREELSCAFYPLPHPACASVYRREEP